MMLFPKLRKSLTGSVTAIAAISAPMILFPAPAHAIASCWDVARIDCIKNWQVWNYSSLQQCKEEEPIFECGPYPPGCMGSHEDDCVSDRRSVHNLGLA